MKYIVFALSFYLAVSCDVKNQNSTADSSARIDQIAEASPKKEMPIADRASELKSAQEEKAQMTKEKMQDAKDDLASKVEDMADKPKEAMNKMKDKMFDKTTIAKSEMDDKHDMGEKELPMAKEEVTEAIASKATTVATTTTAETPTVKKEVMKEKKEGY